jgi:hypothetical protein
MAQQVTASWVRVMVVTAGDGGQAHGIAAAAKPPGLPRLSAQLGALVMCTVADRHAQLHGIAGKQNLLAHVGSGYDICVCLFL